MLSVLLHPEPLLLLRCEASHTPAQHSLILGLPFASSKHHCPDNGLWSDRLTPNILAERSLWDHVPCRLPCLERGWQRCGPFSVTRFSLSRMEPVTGAAKARRNGLNYAIGASATGCLQIHHKSTKDTALVHARRRRRAIDYKSHKTKTVRASDAHPSYRLKALPLSDVHCVRTVEARSHGGLTCCSSKG